MWGEAKDRTSLVLPAVLVVLAFSEMSAAMQPLAKWADILNLGATFSVYSYGRAPYDRSAPFLTFDERTLFSNGSKAFISRFGRDAHAPLSLVPRASANAQSCEGCHFMDGRGRAHATDLELTGLSVVNSRNDGGHRVFRTPAAADSQAARLSDVQWIVASRIVLSGGEIAELVKPVAVIDGIEQMVDLRNAPGVYGLGLLEAIPKADIVAHAEARAYDRFGIGGIVPIAMDAGGSGQLGRFGWKGSHASVSDQVLSAVTAELGIVDGGRAGSGAEDQAFANLTADLTAYLRLLAVPARRLSAEAAYRTGADLFDKSGCTMCHTPSWQTGTTTDLEEKYRHLQIYPFTDMLLHDMGPELGDPSGTDLSRYWRTPPLWGIGVQHGVAQDAGFLHDGRARTFVEAILWHGGEARQAVDLFRRLSPEERADLTAFLTSL